MAYPNQTVTDGCRLLKFTVIHHCMMLWPIIAIIVRGNTKCTFGALMVETSEIAKKIRLILSGALSLLQLPGPGSEIHEKNFSWSPSATTAEVCSALFNKRQVYCWDVMLFHSWKKNKLLFDWPSCLVFFPQSVPSGIPLPPELKPPTRPKTHPSPVTPLRGKKITLLLALLLCFL